MSTAADRPVPGEGVPTSRGAEPREPGSDASPDEIEADIARTRHELGETVAALSDKLDPKVQAEKQAEHLKARARDQVDHARESAQSTFNHARDVVTDPDNPAPGLIAALVGAAVFASLGLLITRRR